MAQTLMAFEDIISALLPDVFAGAIKFTDFACIRPGMMVGPSESRDFP